MTTDIDFVEIAREIDKPGMSRKRVEEIAAKMHKAKNRAKAVITLLRYQTDVRSPEHDLMFAVLSQAILDLGGGAKHDTESAKDYFMHGRYRYHSYLCGLEPEYVIDRLMRYKLLKRRPPGG